MLEILTENLLLNYRREANLDFVAYSQKAQEAGQECYCMPLNLLLTLRPFHRFSISLLLHHLRTLVTRLLFYCTILNSLNKDLQKSSSQICSSTFQFVIYHILHTLTFSHASTLSFLDDQLGSPWYEIQRRNQSIWSLFFQLTLANLDHDGLEPTYYKVEFLSNKTRLRDLMEQGCVLILPPNNRISAALHDFLNSCTTLCCDWTNMNLILFLAQNECWRAL